MGLDFKQLIQAGIPVILPEHPGINSKLPHAPVRNIIGLLTKDERKLAIANALRYFPVAWHETLAPEFAKELDDLGRIYMFRFIPQYKMNARPISHYPAKIKEAAGIMLMIQNNLDPSVAKYPEELITYGGNGAVFQNWAQYLLVMKYLSEMDSDQTLVLYSGHPLGLFPSHHNAPRVVITNGMMIPNYSTKKDWNKYNALGVTQYGQMTAGSFMYIGPQGIVHGTTITLLNAGRINKLGNDLAGKVFVTSGLGGMSGAQSKAIEITGGVGLIAEVDYNAVQQRINDGYIKEENVFTDLNLLKTRLDQAVGTEEAVTLSYFGNIVDLWEFIVEKNIKIELGSDQTSLHNIDDLGYCPAGYSFEEAATLMNEDKPKFDNEIRKTLIRHVKAINTLCDRGMYFWDYGNAFLLEAGKAGADIWKDKASNKFKYPSYVEDIMGPLCFDLGFGPFRWVCTSGKDEDLRKTDKIASQILNKMLIEAGEQTQNQIKDNIKWIDDAEKNLPIVGSHSRILYADAKGRIEIAQAFNEAIESGHISAPVILGRDHHDVSGTDSPYRETSNIYDGSSFTADMAIHNVIGDSFRGATWVSIHNGGGVGWGEVINGGFGMMLDGSAQAESNLKSMLHWDVNNGIARRSWARNQPAIDAINQAMKEEPRLKVTVPNLVDSKILDTL